MQKKKLSKEVTLCVCLLGIIGIVCTGCRVKKSDIVQEKGEKISGEIVKVENAKGNKEKIVSQFLGISMEDLKKNASDYDENSFVYDKGTQELCYTDKSLEGIGPIFSYKDEYEMAGSQYETLINVLTDGHSRNLIDWGLRQIFKDDDLENCSKEEALQYCTPYAELLGYKEDNSEVEVYAITYEQIKNQTDVYAPIKGLENKKILSIDELSELESDYAWSEEDEALYVVYKPIINDLIMDSEYCFLEMIYVPGYEKIVFAKGEIPWKVKEILKTEELISKERAIAEALLVNHIQKQEEVEIADAELVYSSNIEDLEKEKKLTLCWRVNIKRKDNAQYSEADAYTTTLVNAVTGEECVMWPGLND